MSADRESGRMSPLLEAAARYCRRHGLRHDIDGDILGVAVDNILIIVMAFDNVSTLWFSSRLVPGKGSQYYRPIAPALERDASLYLMGANYKILFGRFSRDHSDGEVIYEDTLTTFGNVPSDQQIEDALGIVIFTVQRYAPALENLLNGRMSLPQALADLDRRSGGGGGARGPVAV
jgi:hypothetical protein